MPESAATETATRAGAPAWPEGLAPYWLEQARVLRADRREDERPGTDSLGNAGRVRRIAQAGTLGVQWTRERTVAQLEEAGLKTLQDLRGESRLLRPRPEERPEDVDPFLIEDSVQVRVRGRDFAGRQRAVLEEKVARLRDEIAAAGTDDARRAQAQKMVASMEAGLRTTVEMRAVERRFKPAFTVQSRVRAMGTIVPIRAGSRIVYRVVSLDEDGAQAVSTDDESDVMVFHVAALGAREVILLFTGGVLGLRHVRDLEHSHRHDAWFANRERAKTDATAPWLGRVVYRELIEAGRSSIVIHARRDIEPAGIEVIEETTHTLRVDGEERDVPALLCLTTQEDELIVLADPAAPLVLSLREAGAELVRTVDEILRPIAD